MKRTLLTLALASILITPALSRAACTIGKTNDPPSSPPASSSTAPMPAILGSAPGNTRWIDATGIDTPPGASVGIWRFASNVVDMRLPILDPAPPEPPPTGGGGNRCDSITTHAVGGATSYIERAAIAGGLRRHRIELDFTYYQGNSDPVSGARSWWPVAAWILPTGAPYWGSNLRVDYSGVQTGYAWTNVNALFHVYLDEVYIGNVVSETNTPTMELNWSTTGVVSLSFDAGAVPGSHVVEIPVVLDNPIVENFQPSHFQVGRVHLPYTLRPSLGTVYAYSHLMEGTATTAP
jgi:hypothetical protein